MQIRYTRITITNLYPLKLFFCFFNKKMSFFKISNYNDFPNNKLIIYQRELFIYIYTFIKTKLIFYRKFFQIEFLPKQLIYIVYRELFIFTYITKNIIFFVGKFCKLKEIFVLKRELVLYKIGKFQQNR